MDTPSFVDGLGPRIAATGPVGEHLETLWLCAEVPATLEIQEAIVERASKLAHFDHPAFAHVRRIERRGQEPRASLAVVSEAVEGVRLSDLLRESERRLADRDLDAAAHLLLQAAGNIAALHRFAPEAAHGAIGPERLVLRPDGTLVVVEHVLGSALEALRFSRLQLWGLFRVPAPAAASSVRFDQQTDVMQLGVLALALLLGRVLRREELPHALPAVLEEAASPDAGRNYAGCSRATRGWIARALQFDARTAFRSAVEAEHALVSALREDRSCRPAAAAVQRFLAGCSFESLGRPPASTRPQASSSGAVVAVGSPDRGSGAHRVARQQPVSDSEPPRVLAEFPSAPTEAGRRQAPAEPPGDAPRDPAVVPPGERPRGNWLSRLLPR
jgi:hypothetical protein